MQQRPYTLWICLLVFTLSAGTVRLTAQDTTPEQTPEVTESVEERLLVNPPRPVPFQTITDSGITLDVLFDRLPQGRAGLMHLHGENISEARLRFLDQTVPFFATTDGYYALLVADMDQSARTYEFSVFVVREDNSRLTLNGMVEVVLGGFIRQDGLTVPPDRAYLLDPQVERNEFAQLFSVFNIYTEDKLWGEDGRQFPINSEITSAFGAYRTFNQSVPARHTGWDMRAATGTPVMAMASGKVAFAGVLDIRGNHIVIDHGYGIYSGYSHLSQIHVTRGQTITRGQIIGVSGNTGRSGGAHLHWEVAVNGKYVDSVDFINMWLP
ncbi:MAG: hypothetical protein OHK0046_11760 [Anaerolineae bacterium]